jgi:hypothetical protein
MDENTFIEKLKLKYEYVYSFMPEGLWRWVFRNLIKQKL